MSFNCDFTDWQYASGVIIPKQRGLMIENITIYCAYDYNANYAYFTNISLVLEPAETYSYDSKGNPIAATDGNAKTASEFFADSQRLKSYTTPSGAKHTLGYDASNNLQSDELAGLTNYTYHNTSGSVTLNMTRKGYSGDYLKSANTYDSTRRFRTQSTDANGVTTEYGYDSATAHLLRTTAANGTQQEYRYYSGSDRTAFTYIGGTASIDYVYDRAQLTDLIRKAFPQAADASGNNVNPFWQHYLLGYDTFGNMTRVQVCASSAEREGYTAPVTLASYTYEGNVNNGRLAKMAYGNDDSVSYTYDAFDRQRTAAYNDVDRTTHERKNVATYHYDYSSDNALTRQYATDSDGKITEQYSYQYDSLGRLIHSRQSTADGSLIQLTQHMYDNANRMTSQTWQFGTGLYRQQYTYTGQNSDDKVDGTISAITTTVPGQSVITSTYGYNDLRQLTSKGVTVPDQNGKQTKVYDRTYTYDRIAVDSGNWMGTRLASTGYTFGSNSRSFTYTYDDSGNITRIVLSGGSLTVGTKSKTYSYDALGQLVKETPGGLARNAVNYTYDTAGNIRSITKGNTSSATLVKSFGYTNPSWPDLLTSVTANGTTKDVLYEGQSKTSDLPTSGNPVTYYNGRDYHFDWSKGRQLTEAVVGGQTVKYAYDMAGVRSSKQVGDTTYSYTTLSGKVMRQAWGDNNALEFVYDDSSQPFAVIYKHGSAAELYYYLVNAQGDVAAILDSSGTMVAFYDYDAWGNCTVYNSSAKVLTDPTSIANINPLHYRGYYYDAETGFYYLQSRYYDPAICRFINADTFATTDANGFLSANMFAYCENNPINNSDPTGKLLLGAMLAGAAVGVLSEFAGNVICNLVTGRPLDENLSTLGDYAAAAFSGALSAIPGGGALLAVADVVGSSVIKVGVDSLMNKGGNSAKECVTNFGMGIGAGSTSAITNLRLEKSVPKTISSIKTEARASGVRGTKGYRSFLSKRQIKVGTRNRILSGVSGVAIKLLGRLFGR